MHDGMPPPLNVSPDFAGSQSLSDSSDHANSEQYMSMVPGGFCPSAICAEVLHELDRLARLILRRVVVVVELDLARIDALGAAVEARRPGEQVRALCVGEVARADDVNVVERLVVLAREIPAHAGAEVLGVERVIEIVQIPRP